MTDRPAFVLLEDGAWFPGTSARPIDPAFGEVVFTTNLTGYQETFTDPSYLGQIVVMTAPMIGNYGVNTDDMESGRPQVTGVVVRELSRHPSNWRSTRSLDDWLSEAGIPVLEGIDTRRLTRHLRERGAMRGVVAEGRQPSRELTSRLLASPSMEGLDLASRATVQESWSEGEGPVVVAYDYGMKRNIVRMLVNAGCRVTVVPAETSAADVRRLNPDGLFLSNGPGDPAAVDYALGNLRDLAARNVSAEDEISFLGAGMYDHYVPALVDSIISRSEFLTPYTPYQPEVSQGTLQVMFEYQTAISELTGLPVSNATLYEGPSALGAAGFLAYQHHRRTRFLISRGVHPHARETLRTMSAGWGIEVQEIPLRDGVTDAEALQEASGRTSRPSSSRSRTSSARSRTSRRSCRRSRRPARSPSARATR